MNKLKSLLNPNTKQFWDKKYGKYLNEKRLRKDGKLLKRFMHLFEAAESILDFGSGLGSNVQNISSQLENRRFILVDHSEVSQYFAKNELLGSEDTKGNSFEYYFNLEEVPESSIDLVMSIEVLEHITEYKKLMDQLWARLKPGGIMLISVPVKGIRDRNRQHVNKFTVNSMFKILIEYSDIVQISPRTFSKRSGILATAYFYVRKQ